MRNYSVLYENLMSNNFRRTAVLKKCEFEKNVKNVKCE